MLGNLATRMNVYIIAGPNGAGKTTFAREFLPNYADCQNFVNADLIAAEMAPSSPESVAFQAGRRMLSEIELCRKRRIDFGFETTLSGKSHIGLIRRLKTAGYATHLFYLWIPSVDVALLRVKERVLKGGHGVPERDVRRRFVRSWGNFLTQYRRVVDAWFLFDNSGKRPQVIAFQKSGQRHIINEGLFGALVNE